ncbi:1,3-beta-glucanosyltransferase [Venustampulla echinocandica]|uniref:1,3-beta-glucanosyltransferase n=1 Tax=Venustampulla echinocandica TaxID=2656787 RepID=A0A370T9Z3_9HELO|nr:1,3-beta-glucanosyltransferase [Venustampulla echinocandica]RDL30451.1 1,3-beta-glucanosyltransferase [Venustampulla echinocandica]
MKTSGIVSIAAAALSGLLFTTPVAAADLPPIIIKGSHFFYENGTEFFIRGVAYQQDINGNGTTSANGLFTDPLADAAGCTRDVPLLKELGTNVIRVYAIDPTKDHKTCMNLLQESGIYVIQDLSNPVQSIIRDAPEWNTELFASYAAVIDEMAPYTNTLGFFAGNEVSNDVNNTNASAFVKAAVRDMKAYIKTKNYRTIGVGYATNDDGIIRTSLANYFNCGNRSDSIDFWGYNIYSWCGESSFTASGYDQRTLEFANYSVPAFFAEYGCNQVKPRPFTEVQALYGPNMTGVWSGGIVYMYFQEANEFGLVTVSGGKATKLPDFTALSKQLASVTAKSTAMAAYQVTNTAAQACPATGTAWAAARALPPIANADVCSCMVSSLSCVPSSGMSGNATAQMFSTVCGLSKKACEGITANATTGVYGAYSMCSATQKLSFAFDQYYQSQGKASTACNFDGKAKIVSPSVSSSCKPLINQAGVEGTGTVTTAPTGTGSPSGSSNSNSSSGSGSSKNSAAGALRVPGSDLRMLQLGACVLVAGIAGVGVTLL